MVKEREDFSEKPAKITELPEKSTLAAAFEPTLLH
jgi:hypothetical protein